LKRDGGGNTADDDGHKYLYLQMFIAYWVH